MRRRSYCYNKSVYSYIDCDCILYGRRNIFRRYVHRSYRILVTRICWGNVRCGISTYIIDRSKPEVLNLKVNSLIGEVTLAIFLSMALMSINLGEISGNVLPIIVALILQIALMAIFASTILFRLLGKDYDSAIMVAGFIGHGLGATPNAMANMHSVTQQHGMSHKAFLIVPIVGAFLIEVLTVPIILATINLFS